MYNKYKNQGEELTPEEKFNRMYEKYKLDLIRSGVLREYRERQYFMKPGEKRRKKIAEAKAKAKQNRKRRMKGSGY